MAHAQCAMFALIYAFLRLDAIRGVKAKRFQAAIRGGVRSMHSVDRPKQPFPMAALCAAIVIKWVRPPWRTPILVYNGNSDTILIINYLCR